MLQQRVLYQAQLRVILALLFSVIMMWYCYRSLKEQEKTRRFEKYGDAIGSGLIIFHLLWFYGDEFIGASFYETTDKVRLFISWLFGSMVHMSLFFLIILCLIPVLRKYISSKICAELWIFPVTLIFSKVAAVSKPLVVVKIPEKWIGGALTIWLIGFVIVILGNIFIHLRYRHSILKDSIAATAPKIVRTWNREFSQTIVPRDLELVLSPNVKTPLTIGLFRRYMKVVLPIKDYSVEQLQLIFRHEFAHIKNEDYVRKFLMMIYAAICWFHPLMWIAMKKWAEDLELSCDEMVLQNEDEDKRKMYAELILQTAGSNRGFSTCLSASATSLRYRLRNILTVKKSRNGIWLIGILMFIFLMTSGYVTLAYRATNGAAVVSEGEQVTLTHVIMKDEQGYQHYYDGLEQREAFLAYFSELKLLPIEGTYTFSDFDATIYGTFYTDKGPASIEIVDRFVRIIEHELFWKNPKVYYLEQDVDWEYLATLL